MDMICIKGFEGYGVGWRAARNATGKALSGTEFDLPREAASRAKESAGRGEHGRYDYEDEVEWMLDFACGFVAYCSRHSGTWTALVPEWQGPGWYVLGFEDSADECECRWFSDEEELADDMASNWVFSLAFPNGGEHVPAVGFGLNGRDMA